MLHQQPVPRHERLQTDSPSTSVTSVASTGGSPSPGSAKVSTSGGGGGCPQSLPGLAALPSLTGLTSTSTSAVPQTTVLQEAVDAVVNSYAKHTAQGSGKGKQEAKVGYWGYSVQARLDGDEAQFTRCLRFDKLAEF